MTERVLVNYFYSHAVGHAVEALHYCLGHHAADSSPDVSVVLNAATPIELAGFCPFISAAYAVDQPLLEPSPAAPARQASIPREWDWVLDDFRRWQDIQLELFPGLRDYYRASDAHLIARRGRGVVGADPPGYVRHRQLRFALPEEGRAAAAERFERHASGGDRIRIALMPAGSADRALYPSVVSWQTILDALADALPGVTIALIGKHARDARTASSFGPSQLLQPRPVPLDHPRHRAVSRLQPIRSGSARQR